MHLDGSGRETIITQDSNTVTIDYLEFTPYWADASTDIIVSQRRFEQKQYCHFIT